VRCESKCVPEEATAVASESGALASDREVLAREAATDEVDRADEPCVSCPAIRSPNVVVPWHVRPVLCEDLPAVLVDLHLADALVPSLLKAQVKAADAGEQTDEFHGAESSPKEDGTGVRQRGVAKK
jgi:hypothetical protein